MAVISTHAPEPEKVYPEMVESGKLYTTADGFLAYALTPTLFALLNDPEARVLCLNSARKRNARFPFTPLPPGFSVTIRQEG